MEAPCVPSPRRLPSRRFKFFKRDFKFVERIMASFVNAWRLPTWGL